MYCVKLYRNGKKLDEQIFDNAEKALHNMLIMITAAAFSCDDIPNISAKIFECEVSEKKKNEN